MKRRNPPVKTTRLAGMALLAATALLGCTIKQQVDLVLKKASFSPYDPIRLYRFPATIIV